MAEAVREDTLIRILIGADVGRRHVERSDSEVETSQEIPRQARDDKK